MSKRAAFVVVFLAVAAVVVTILLIGRNQDDGVAGPAVGSASVPVSASSGPAGTSASMTTSAMPVTPQSSSSDLAPSGTGQVSVGPSETDTPATTAVESSFVTTWTTPTVIVPTVLPTAGSKAMDSLESLPKQLGDLLEKRTIVQYDQVLADLLPKGSVIKADPSSWRPDSFGGGLMAFEATTELYGTQRYVAVMTNDLGTWKLQYTFSYPDELPESASPSSSGGAG